MILTLKKPGSAAKTNRKSTHNSLQFETVVSTNDENFINWNTYNVDYIYFDIEGEMYFKEPSLENNTHRNLTNTTIKSNKHSIPSHRDTTQPSNRDINLILMISRPTQQQKNL